MVSDWVETTLGDISNDVSYGYTESANTEKVGPKFLRITDIQNGVVDWKSVPYCPIDNSKLDKYLLEKGDIVVARTGNSTGENYIFTGSEETVYASYLIRFRIDENIANPFYVWYSMRSPNWWSFVNSSKTGSAQAGANAKVLGLYPLDLPSLDTQKAIAHILGSLDDKIELNRQMNETLEAMAQALFKSWFVDFDPVIDNALAVGNTIPDDFAERAEQRKGIEKKDNSDIQDLFPDEFEFTEEMGWIPKGWEVKRIKDIGKVVTGKTPPKKIDNAYSENGIPFITPTDIDDLPFVIYTNRYLSEDGVQAVKNSRISAGSICVTCIGSQMGKTTIAPLASVSNQQINSITGCNQFWRNYLFFNLRRRRDEIFLLGSSGSTMPILNKSNFEAFPILCPNEKLLSSLDSNFQSTIDSILENTKQSYTLTKLRDTLLPKLMSGELRITNDIL